MLKILPKIKALASFYVEGDEKGKADQLKPIKVSVPIGTTVRDFVKSAFEKAGMDSSSGCLNVQYSSKKFNRFLDVGFDDAVKDGREYNIKTTWSLLIAKKTPPNTNDEVKDKADESNVNTCKEDEMSNVYVLSSTASTTSEQVNQDKSIDATGDTEQLTRKSIRSARNRKSIAPQLTRKSGSARLFSLVDRVLLRRLFQRQVLMEKKSPLSRRLSKTSLTKILFYNHVIFFWCFYSLLSFHFALFLPIFFFFCLPVPAALPLPNLSLSQASSHNPQTSEHPRKSSASISLKINMHS